MQPELKNPLHKAVSFLDEKGYRYAIIGGIAFSQWGPVRTTRDVDIKVLVPEMNYLEVRQAILKVFPERSRGHLPENSFIVAVKIDEIIVDFLLTLPGYEENIIERAVKKNLGDLSVWICAPEDLIIQKVVANRERDWPDVEGVLIQQWGKLDHEYIENWLSQFSEAFEQTEAESRYHSIKKKVGELLS